MVTGDLICVLQHGSGMEISVRHGRAVPVHDYHPDAKGSQPFCQPVPATTRRPVKTLLQYCEIYIADYCAVLTGRRNLKARWRHLGWHLQPRPVHHHHPDAERSESVCQRVPATTRRPVKMLLQYREIYTADYCAVLTGRRNLKAIWRHLGWHLQPRPPCLAV